MNEQELRQLLYDLESDRVERTESVSNKDKICQAICAFANDLPDHQKPGILFIGARDDGSCAGLAITDRLLQELGGIRSEGNILPLPSMTVQKMTIEGCDLAVVMVQPSKFPPLRYKGITWIRVGPRRAIATIEEERRLLEKSYSANVSFDQSPIYNGKMEDLNLNYFRIDYLKRIISKEILEANNRSIDQQLSSLYFVTEHDLRLVPTIVGILVLGNDVGYYLPGAYIQYVRFDGDSLTSPIVNQKRLQGRVGEILNQLDELLNINISTAIDITSSPTEIRHPDYPLAALQQLARNAVLHRNYQGTNSPVRIYWFTDRVEITSPGGPFGQVSKANFESGITDYRNPRLAEVMHKLGFIQKFGVGLSIAKEALKNNGNPSPKFDVQDTYIAATIWSAQ